MAPKPPSKQHTPNLLSLPPEILIFILEHACSFADLRALILTTPKFNNVWKGNMTSITSTLIQRSLICYPEVRQFTCLFSHNFQHFYPAYVPPRRVFQPKFTYTDPEVMNRLACLQNIRKEVCRPPKRLPSTSEFSQMRGQHLRHATCLSTRLNPGSPPVRVCVSTQGGPQ